MPRRLFAIALLVCGCGTNVTFTALDGAPRRPRLPPGAQVDVYLSAPPNRPYHDVGLLEAEQMSEFSVDETRDMLRKMRGEAARYGCDAIYVKGVGAHGQTSVFLDGNAASVKAVSATCIRYND